MVRTQFLIEGIDNVLDITTPALNILGNKNMSGSAVTAVEITPAELKSLLSLNLAPTDNYIRPSIYTGDATYLKTVGTITTGRWSEGANVKTLLPQYGGTGYSTYANYDILRTRNGASATTLTKVSGSAVGNVLTHAGWAPISETLFEAETVLPVEFGGTGNSIATLSSIVTISTAATAFTLSTISTLQAGYSLKSHTHSDLVLRVSTHQTEVTKMSIEGKFMGGVTSGRFYTLSNFVVKRDITVSTKRMIYFEDGKVYGEV